MTLQQLADLGTFVGGIVVVISVLYVAVQVRQNSRLLARTVQSIRTQTQQSLVEDFNFYRQLLMDRDVADLYSRGLADYGSLESADRVRFNMVASCYVWTAWYFYQVNKNEGLIEHLNDRLYADMFRHPGFREWFESYRSTVGGDYGEFLARVLENVGDSTYEPSEISNLLQGRLQ